MDYIKAKLVRQHQIQKLAEPWQEWRLAKRIQHGERTGDWTFDPLKPTEPTELQKRFQ